MLVVHLTVITRRDSMFEKQRTWELFPRSVVLCVSTGGEIAFGAQLTVVPFFAVGKVEAIKS